MSSRTEHPPHETTQQPLLRIGVLALQGSFREHIACLNRLDNVEGVEVRTREDLSAISGLIIPGGESTTMALIAERWGLIPELQSFSNSGKPVWGTCAGMIFLANRASGQKKGGQALLGGLDCFVHRNFFGAQINSFETLLPPPDCLPTCNGEMGPFRAVFIRAPAVLEPGPDVEVLSEYHLSAEEAASAGKEKVSVAVRCRQLLATSFHPELTEDLRWHQLFVDMVREQCNQAGAANGVVNASEHNSNNTNNINSVASRKGVVPADLPVFRSSVFDTK